MRELIKEERQQLVGVLVQGDAFEWFIFLYEIVCVFQF